MAAKIATKTAFELMFLSIYSKTHQENTMLFDTKKKIKKALTKKSKKKSKSF